MANDIKNKLVVKCSKKEELENFLEKIKGDNEYNGRIQDLDFNRIIQMPIELAATSESTATSEAIYYYLVKTNKNDLLPKLLYYPQFYSLDRFTNKSQEELQEIFKVGERYYNNYVKYGYTTWYGWAINNWGSKWNCYETWIEECSNTELTMYFETANSGVPNIVFLLSKMFPTFSFEYKFADEDLTYNCGEGYTNDEGEFIFNRLQDGSDEAFECYCECWQESAEDYIKTENGWEYNWEDDD